MLNEDLLVTQQVTPEQQDTLKFLYKRLNEAINTPEHFSDLCFIPKHIEEIEFQLQDNWNFDRDRTKHTHWYRVKDCTCPILDNRELWGIDRRIINSSCKWHGGSNA